MKEFITRLVRKITSVAKKIRSRVFLTRRRLVLVLTLVTALGLAIFSFKNRIWEAKTPPSTDGLISAASSQDGSTATINREFQFPINDSRGKEITKLNYAVESGLLTKTIIVAGQQGTAAPGRQFLVLNLKLRNDSNQGVRINTRDYLRVSVGSGSDWLAADIHNDPVEVQPISTKFTRLGFPVNASSKDFKIQVGEINGSKTSFDLNFK